MFRPESILTQGVFYFRPEEQNSNKKEKNEYGKRTAEDL